LKAKTSSISKNFILFFLLAVIFWFLTKLSKEYESTVMYPVSYENLPQDKLLQETPDSEIGIHIKATGFKILSAKLFPQTIEIDASNLSAKSATEYYLLLSQQRLAIQKQMNAGVDIDHFINESIDLSLGSLQQKKVPVKLNSQINYQLGYNVNGDIVITPDSITVSGPESILDTLQYVETIPLVMKNVASEINETIDLKSFTSSNKIKFDQASVTLSAAVEKFTEGTQKVSFVILNPPQDVTMNTFPKEVIITYKVALSNFNQVNASSFLVECDYLMSSENNLSYLVPKLARQPDMVKNVKIAPSKIEFVIEK
jgi:hypothetical protein